MGVKGLRARDLWVPVDSIEITASLPRHGTQFSRLTKYVSLLTGHFGAKDAWIFVCSHFVMRSEPFSTSGAQGKM